MATSTPTNNFYGGERPGDNLYAESIICVEARTGARVWHFQAIHHGIWDYDFAAMPVLGDITVDGRTIKAIMQVSKQAFTYVFDRATGEPVWPIEERPVPPSTVPGEVAAPTQPFPTRPPAFDLQGTGEDNLIDLTPELRRRALEKLRQFDYGPLYTPPTERGTLMLPGLIGAASWGGAGFDHETGILYVPVAHVAVHRQADPPRRAAAPHPAPGRRRHDRRGHSPLQAALGAADGVRHEPGRDPVDQPASATDPATTRCCAISICPRSATTSTARACW